LNLSSENIFSEIISSTRTKNERLELIKLLASLEKNDTLIVSELSRLGRNTIEVLQTVKDLLSRNIELRLLKENLIINGAESITAKLIIPILSAINELERDRISNRTKQALKTKKEQGIKLGRPKGSFSKSKLDKHVETIKKLLAKKVSIQSIARIINCSKQTLHNYIKMRNLRNNN
ncbi:recombinase family protein, partial [bacterium]|nr:recombinase family protein [bacterium]